MIKLELSIIMPVFNAELFVAEAIQSVLNQTFKNLELIVINDGSNDNSKSVIQSFNDPRIKYFENPRNSGIVFSRNLGLKLAQGNYIGMLDADDIAHPKKFEKQIAFLHQNKDYGLIGSWVRFIDKNSEKLPGGWKLKAEPEMIPAIMLFKNYFLQSSVLYRRECISNYSFKKDYNIGEDYIIWFEILKKWKGWNLQQYLVDYRVHDGSITKRFKEEKLIREYGIFKLMLSALTIEPSDEELKMHIMIHDNKQIVNFNTLLSIEKWLLKLIDHNNKSDVYDRKIFTKVVFNRWIKVCYKSSGLHFKMLYKLISSQILFRFIKS